MKTKNKDMIRKQFMLTKTQADYLAQLSRQTGDSEAHFVRQALNLLVKIKPTN